MSIMSLLHISIQPQPILSARFASFAGQHTYRYVSSQELTKRTRQNSPHLTDGNME